MTHLTGQLRRATWGRAALLCGALLALVASLAVSIAGAAPAAGIDSTYGDGGVVKVTGPAGVPAGYEYLTVHSFGPAADGSAYVLGSVYDCVPYCAGRGSEVLSRYESDGSLDASFGGIGSVPLPAVMTHASVVADGDGAAMVGGVVEKRTVLRRYDPSGVADASFGSDGVVTLPWHGGYGQLRVLSEPDGKILVAVDRSWGGHGNATRFWLTRLGPDGSLDPSFGTAGTAAFTIHGPGEPRAVVSTVGGATLIGGSGGKGCCEEKRVYLWRVSGAGRVDRRFDRASRYSLKRLMSLGKYLRMRAIVPLPDGKIAALGTSKGGRAGFYLRLRPDGRLDAGFPGRGLERLPFTVEAAVPASAGAVFAVGTPNARAYDGAYRAFRILGGGSLDPAYGKARGIKLPLSGVRIGATPLSGGQVLITDNGNFYCRSSCRSEPAMVRFQG